MRICDVNTHIGPWPFRPLAFTDAKHLLERMDKLGIARAAVCHNHAVFYKNAQRANEELHEEVKAHANRLVPVATLNPAYIDAEADLRVCVGQFGMRMLRLLPCYHDYDLNSSLALDFAHLAAELHLTVVVPARLVDIRQRHWMDAERNVSLEELTTFAQQIPSLKIVATECAFKPEPDTMELLQKAPNVIIECSRFRCLTHGFMEQSMAQLGAGRFVFGTGMPFKVPQSALLKLATIKNAADRSVVAVGNFDLLTQDSTEKQ